MPNPIHLVKFLHLRIHITLFPKKYRSKDSPFPFTHFPHQQFLPPGTEHCQLFPEKLKEWKSAAEARPQEP